MDQIIIYREEYSYKHVFEQKKLSYQRKYRLVFATVYEQIAKVVNEVGSGVLLYYITPMLTEKDVLRLRTIQRLYPGLKVCLCADKRFALQAWRLSMFHFVSLDKDAFEVLPAYHKYVLAIGSDANEYSIKTPEGIIKIALTDIGYLKADGNYTSLYLTDGRHIVETKQLGKYTFLLEQDDFFKRVHRSLILNTRNIKALSNGVLSFYHSDLTLPVSDRLGAKVKRLLLGH
jgi:DNA-binding LytR/AlgR family response regulator